MMNSDYMHLKIFLFPISLNHFPCLHLMGVYIVQNRRKSIDIARIIAHEILIGSYYFRPVFRQ